MRTMILRKFKGSNDLTQVSYGSGSGLVGGAQCPYSRTPVWAGLGKAESADQRSRGRRAKRFPLLAPAVPFHCPDV